MKKIYLSLCLIFLISISHAQKIYFKAGGGYGLPAITHSIGENYNMNFDQNTGETTSTLENVSGSYGAGLNFNVGGGYMFSKYLGVDLNVQFQQGKKYEIVARETSTGSFSRKAEFITTTNGTAIFINPSLVITPGAGSMLPYGRFGVVIGSPKIKDEESYYNDFNGEETAERESEYTKGIAFGFQGAIGFNFAINNNLDIYTEVNFIGLTYYPKEYEVTKYIVNDVDRLDDLTVQQKRTEYKKEIDLENEPSADEPEQELRIEKAFSSISLQVGIKFTLGGRQTE